MLLGWDNQNLEPIGRHGVSQEQAEAALGSGDAVLRQDATRLNRWVVGATMEDRTLKVAIARVITAHWMRSKRRRTR